MTLDLSGFFVSLMNCLCNAWLACVKTEKKTGFMTGCKNIQLWAPCTSHEFELSVQYLIPILYTRLACVKTEKKASFMTGCKNFQLSALVRHMNPVNDKITATVLLQQEQFKADSDNARYEHLSDYDIIICQE